MRRTSILILSIAAGLFPAYAADWSPKLAARFLDERQKQWFAWPAAAKTGGPCVSCHTGLPYLIARPALRRALGESAPTEWETGYRDALRNRVDIRDPKRLGYLKEPNGSQALGVESIFAALFLDRDTDGRRRLWDLQLADGPARGGWNWFELELDPWENTEAPFFGAALASLAADNASPEPARALAAYLKDNAAAQPLQNRLAVLWTARKLPNAIAGSSAREWTREAFSKQSADGGWTNEALGPWKPREAAPPSSGSNAYATAFAAYALLEGGEPATEAHMARALAWLRSHQNPEFGYWDASSMNKRYPAGSMQEQFMRDAATSFAAAALLKQ